jgi:nicotinate-nucleotide--dimethylbenzimidazole phosphoribosyltransferase
MTLGRNDIPDVIGYGHVGPYIRSTLMWRRALVLGGIRSGKSEYAEGLVAPAAAVRYVATARRGGGDAEWEGRIEAHRARRPATWSTSEVGDDPFALPDLLRAASVDDNLLVDDLGTWLAGVIEVTPPEDLGQVATNLAGAVRACAARVVLVSPEVGLSLVPATTAGRIFADALGATNRAISAECDTVALVIAGNAVPVKGGL